MSKLAIALAALLGLAASAEAGPLGLGLPALPGGLGTLTSRATGTLDQDMTGFNNTVRDTVGRPRTPRAFEKDANGARVVPGEVLALSPSEKSLAIAHGLNFGIVRQANLDALGLKVTVLSAPDGMSASDALAALRKADPEGAYDVDHIYDPSGSASDKPASNAVVSASHAALRVGMIDGGIDRRHDVFAHATIIARGFMPNASSIATQHGTAVASLLVGSDSDVTGVLPEATLYVADVYCGQPAGGSADAIVEALGWLAANEVPVVNVSLSGPPNAILAAAVNAFIERGHVLVAAVGNDGPAAGIEYPAGYPGVVGVTSVGADHAIQLEANRGADVAFAATGVDVPVATLNGRHASMTGTSFAAPIVTARFALLVTRADPHVAAQAWSALERAALHLGAPGRNDVYGYGFLDRPASPANATASK
ncbi:MAG TPA: S8 family serine peptidase [Rhizomicrobium sp.]|nr:S8 family serine peptidase [Rhizomicrobium sp.]